MQLRLHVFTSFLSIVAMAGLAHAQLTAPTIAKRLGYPADAKLLIIHADDVGMSHSVNIATFAALEKGWITSASIMVPCPWFKEAADFARLHPEMDLGLHLTLTSEWPKYRWEPVDDQFGTLLDKKGYLYRGERAMAAHAAPEEAAQELRAQIEMARAAGVHFTHFDSHMGTVFDSPQLFQAYQDLAREYHVPSLIAAHGSPHMRRGSEADPDMLLIDRTLQLKPGVPHRWWLKAYKRMLAPLGPGVYELIVHLGYDDPELRQITSHHSNWGACWRQRDLEVISNPEFQKFLREQGFVLVRWKDLARATMPTQQQENRAAIPALQF